MEYIKNKDTAVRLILSIALLWQIWLNAHWSVALAITFMFLIIEIMAYHFRKFIQ